MKNNKNAPGHLQFHGLQIKNRRHCTTKMTAKIINSKVANGNIRDTRILVAMTTADSTISNFGTQHFSLFKLLLL